MSFDIGQKVRACFDLIEAANEHSPALLYAKKDDTLVVRALGIHHIGVAHENEPEDKYFFVEPNEIESIVDKELPCTK